jgi:hypothetical protein
MRVDFRDIQTAVAKEHRCDADVSATHDETSRVGVKLLQN